RLVHRVVQELPHEMMKARAVHAADVHARPLADGFEPFENLNVFGCIFVAHWYPEIRLATRSITPLRRRSLRLVTPRTARLRASTIHSSRERSQSATACTNFPARNSLSPGERSG